MARRAVQACHVPGCQRPRPALLRASFTPGPRARQVKVPVCPWCLLGVTMESRALTAFHARRRPLQSVRERLISWLAANDYTLESPPPPGSGHPTDNVSGVVVDVDLDVERSPEQALHDGLIEPASRGYRATAKGRAAIQQLRRRRLGAHVIHRRLGLGKATVVSLIQQLEAVP